MTVEQARTQRFRQLDQEARELEMLIAGVDLEIAAAERLGCSCRESAERRGAYVLSLKVCRAQLFALATTL